MPEPHRNRVVGLILCAATLAPLIVADYLTPSALGLGTHEQLGLPECGFFAVTGVPCATCGMTTSFAYATHGHLLSAIITQPAGFLVCLACAAFALVGGWAAYSGMSLQPLGQWLGRPLVLFGGLGVVLLSWGYNIMAHLH